MLIQADAFEYLNDFVHRVPCLKEKGFLCGIFAQLEVAWEASEDSARRIIFDILNKHLIPIGSESKHGRVRAWVRSIANTLDHIQWQEAMQSPQQHRFSVLSKTRDYKSGYCNPEMRNETHQVALLQEAWQRCPKAHVFYADLRIREYYTQGRRLEIERLSGKALPMSQCYVNLAIIQHRTELSSKGAAGERNSSPFSLSTRLKLIDPPGELRASSRMLFSPRKQRDGIARAPKRLFIEGQAGIGKTTLCKKIVYDYIHYNIWIDLFDRLIWIPLRELKNQLMPGYNLKDLLYNEYFLDQMDGRLFADALWSVILENSASTLFILDGLDEVAQGFDAETGPIFQNLLNQSHVIITSRPYRSSLEYMKPPDLELETIGFYPNQADAYIVKVVGNGAAGEIQSFMQEHLLIHGLARIPIQLDAICYCWDGISADVPTTMTKLYQAIELSLWRKDAWKLTKVTDRDVAQQLTKSEIIGLVQAEINLLQSFAFTGLVNDIVEFDAKYRDQILQYKDQIMKHLKCSASTTVSTVLDKLSLLRTWDTSDEGHRSYHFLHLTFQEYCAAQYYVEHWKSGKPLPYLKFSNRKARLESILPESFLQREKYNARYDVLWRFVTGMLQAQDEDHLRRFFALIEDEPRDLLGPVHQRLAMHCLSEVDSSNKTSTSISLRENLEEQLLRWALFECELKGIPRLAGDMQFPQSLLEAILEESSEDRRVRLILSLPPRRTSVPSFIKFLTAWLNGDVSPHMMAAVCEALSQHPEDLPEETLNALAERLGDQHYDIRCSALQVLGRQRTLPDGILEDVVKRLEDSDSIVREYAVYALSDRMDPVDELFKAVMVRLKDFDLEGNCESVLGTQSSSFIGLLEALTNPIGPGEPLEALAEPPLSEDILAAVAQRLDDERSKVRKAAANALRGYSTLPGEIVERVAKRLDDKRKRVRKAAARTLSAQSSLAGEMLELMAKRLDDKDSDVREATVYALGCQYDLPEEVLKAVTRLLDDTESYVRQAVANILGFQPSFIRVILLSYWSRSMPGEIVGESFSNVGYDLLAQLMADSDDEDSQTKEAFRSAWSYQLTLPVDILTAMAERLNHEDRQTRKAIARALISQSNLPGGVVEKVAAWLKDGNIKVRNAAARVLEKQSVLSEEIGQALAVVMDDQKDREETNYTDTSSSTEDETSWSPAAEDETSWSSAAEDEIPLLSAMDDEIAESQINEENFPNEEFEEREAITRARPRSPSRGWWNPYLEYGDWLKHSFCGQETWFIGDGNLCLHTTEKLYKLTFKSREKQDQFMAKLQKVRADLGVPQ